jgi:hypothetical protein
MEATLHTLTRRAGAPQLVPIGDGVAFRYAEKSIHQAIVQKLARLVSGLHAAKLLLEAGFIQEQGALQRILDEFEQDILFLCSAVIFDDVTDLHQRYLNAFYMEEFDRPDDPIGSTQKRPMIPREKIQSYLSRLDGMPYDPSTGKAVTRTVAKTYSGYVHGASPHIMEMFGGTPPRFHVSGMRGTPLYEDHVHDLWNYFYRGICSFGFAAKAFGDDALFREIQEYREHFVVSSGRESDVQA